MTDNKPYPDLPPPDFGRARRLGAAYFGDAFTADQMRAYVDADRAMRAAEPSTRQLVSVSSIDLEKMIAACLPSGSICDPQQVADEIRRYCNAWPDGSVAQAAPASPDAHWWRNRADKIEIEVAQSGSPEAMSCYTKMRQLLDADSRAAPAAVAGPVAYLHDDGYWTAAKTEAGCQLNDMLLRAGSPKVGVYLHPHPTTQPEPQPVDDFQPCPSCFGTGVEGDADDYGHTIDVACGDCNGSGRAMEKNATDSENASSRYREKCPLAGRCLQGCLSKEPCYYVAREARVQAPTQAAPQPAAQQDDRKALADSLHNLIDQYWDIAYVEGKENRNHDTEAGDAHRVRSGINCAIAALAAQPQEAAPKAVPEGWVPCVIDYEGGHPEEVAFGPQIMMDRLKKWLTSYFAIISTHPAKGVPAQGDAEDAASLLALLADIRAASGDHGKRMQPELVKHIRELAEDAARLDWLQETSCDLRSIDMPTGAGDSDVHWIVVEHYMDEPREREIGRSFSDDPRAAIDAARAQKGGE